MSALHVTELRLPQPYLLFLGDLTEAPYAKTAFGLREVGREHVLGLPDFALPSLHEAIHLHLQLARRTNPAVRCAGVSLNTSKLPEMEARMLLKKERERLSLPVGDPIRGGAEFDALVEACLTS